ncbi:tRNA1(Val) (adenine(37)-N6)-methyltransferase [Tropicibacter oceani]|uniref:Methyltransferase n=1 Tax=Tropicibacter oceani TaxID=3058420 RepID=A0ABY8QM31_9RHOB|nr:methyltransferase [Tropicibacter oceani]WGW04842.1 methyltransferase [Tropicibacter oceani]
MRADPFEPAALVCDDFLGGQVRLWQPRDGYRAGVDPVLLAASIPARPGQSVLELGCGAGPALCCLGARVPGLALAGLELQAGYADLARRNLRENGHDAVIWDGDLADPPAQMRQRSFDHVMANPPYFEAERRRGADDSGREMALAGPTPMEAWVQTAARRLAPRGTASFIQRAERLPELLAAMRQHLGSIELLPLLPREGRAPRLVLLRGRKGGRADFRFHSGLVLHRGTHHEGDWDSYTETVAGILRHGTALTFG